MPERGRDQTWSSDAAEKTRSRSVRGSTIADSATGGGASPRASSFCQLPFFAPESDSAQRSLDPPPSTSNRSRAAS